MMAGSGSDGFSNPLTQFGDYGGAPAQKQGFLTKQGHVVKNWKRRWFVLREGVLYYYKEDRVSQRGFIPLDNVTISMITNLGKEHCFGLFHPQRPPYFIHGESGSEIVQWIKAIRNDTHVGLIDFDVLSVLGKGNFGKVMLVRHKENGQTFAMKVIRKDALSKKNDVEHTKTERRLLQKIKHPYIVQLHYAFQSADRLYMVMDYISGGDLYYHLRQQRRFNVGTVRVWTSELVISIGYLHRMNVVYRDIKPENLLLDRQGHIHMTDFGLSKVQEKANEPLHTFCGTPYYLAPEMLVEKTGYGKEVDWWGLGILVFEMLSGQPPFYSNNMQRVYEKIVSAEIVWPDHADATKEAKSFVAALLQRDPAKRIGTKGGAEEIKAHPFLAPIDWSAIYNRKIQPGFAPKASTTSQNMDSRFAAPDPLDGADSFDRFGKQSAPQMAQSSAGIPQVSRHAVPPTRPTGLVIPTASGASGGGGFTVSS